MQDFGICLEDLPRRTIVYLLCKGPWRQLPEMLARLSEYAEGKGVKASGPPGAFYHNTTREVKADDLSWEVFYPVAMDTAPFAEQCPGYGVRDIPAARVASIVHRGNYRKAFESYARLQNWLVSQGLKVCGPSEEVYLTDIIRAVENQEIKICLPVYPGLSLV